VSLIDELKGLEDRVAERMKELRPLVDEYRELEQVAQRAEFLHALRDAILQALQLVNE